MKLFNKQISRATVFSAGLFFVCFYTYIWQFGDTRFIYNAFGQFVNYPLFFTGWKFLGNTIDHPGGIVEYLTGFLSQLYYYPFAGALVITIVASLTCLALAILVKIAGWNYWPGFISYIPALFFLAMHTKYDHPLAVFIALLINLWFLVIYERLQLQNLSSRFCLFSAMLAATYYITAGPALIFGILAAAYEIFARRRLLTGVICVLITALLPWIVGNIGFDVRVNDAYLHLLPFEPELKLISKITAQMLYGSILCIVLAMYIRQRFLVTNPTEQMPPDKENKRFQELIQPVAFALAAVGIISFPVENIEKRMLQLNFYSSNQMWPQLLEHAERFPVVLANPVGNHDVIQALYHTGRLSSDLFSHPQSREALFLPAREGFVRPYVTGVRILRLYLQLGGVNMAEKVAYETLENSGDYPELLWSLAIINIVKNQPQAAIAFLETLSRDLIYGKKARAMLERLDKDPQLADDEEIARIRALMPHKDSTEANYSAKNFLIDLLNSNPQNKLAFEYLMTCYLIEKRVGNVVENLPRLKILGYEKIPRHYEEAILIHQSNTRSRFELHGWQLSPEAIEKYNKFIYDFDLYRGDAAEAAQALAKDSGNTYLFYFVFGIAGAEL